MHQFKVQSVKHISASVVLLTIENQAAGSFQFTAGQYAALHFKNRGRPSPVRCFSIVSSPKQPDTLQFAFRITGNYSYRLSQLRPGEDVYVQGPFGDFTINERFDRSLVFLAGGIGITPFMSMLLYLTQTKLNIPVTLVYSSRNASDIPFGQQLLALSRQNPNFRLIFAASNTSAVLPGAQFVNSKIDEDLLAQLDTPHGTTYFLCGPTSFMSGLTAVLNNLGTPKDRVITEAFGQRKLGEVKLPGLPTRRIYAGSALGILLVTSLLASNNLLKSAHVAAARLVQKVESSTDDTPSATSPASDTSTSSDTSTASSSSADSSSSTPSTTPTYTQTYSQPVSSVS